MDVATETAKQTHVKLVGEVLWAWNDLNKALGYAFSESLDHPHPFMGQVLWTALPSDTAQHAQFKAVLDWADQVPDPIKEHYRWVMKQTGDLALHRNDVAHAPVGFVLGEAGLSTIVSPSGSPLKRYMRHREIEMDLFDKMELLRSDLAQLAEFVTAVWRDHRNSEAAVLVRPALKLTAAIHAARQAQDYER